MVAYEAFTDEDKTQDFTPQLTKIKAASPDVLFLLNYYSSVALVAKQARQMGIDIPLLGGDGWDSPELVKLAGDAVEGGYFSSHFSKESPTKEIQDFVKAYSERYGNPPDVLVALGYDAVLILADALRRIEKLDKKAIRDALAETKDLPTISGRITFDKERNPLKDAVILKIENGKPVYHATVIPSLGVLLGSPYF